MKKNPLDKLTALGQSVWLDYIRRDLINNDLKKLIDEDDLRGMTSNPALFEEAIVKSNDYDEIIEKLINEHKDAKTVYEILTQSDVRDAADIFRKVYDTLDAHDGYVSLEVNPHLAHDTQGTLEEARRFWKALDRPNVFIKVPATVEGLPAIQQLISEGINVNVTLLFGLDRYQAVADAYITGIEMRAAQGKPIQSVASVASFFLSRIDVLIDSLLDKIIAQGGEKAELAKKLQGEVAIASAKIAYQLYKKIFSSEKFKKLASHNACTQRLLWASTGTKNPAYSDIKYVDSLIGPETVNTVPKQTLEAYRDHGQPELRLEQDIDHAHWVLQQLPKLGIDLNKITQQLEEEGVEKFNQPFDHLMQTLENKITKKK